MEMDIDEILRPNPTESRRGSVSGDSDAGSVSEGEDDGGRNNPMEEALEVPDPEAGDGRPAEAAKPVKPKRTIQNPMPKLDYARIGGPRGIPVLPKLFKNIKFKGKGHEKEDLDVLLKHYEHWAHRMYPRFPFNNIVEQMEKLGSKKQVQVMMKSYRLDMLRHDTMNEEVEDDVRRGIDEDKDPEPVVDVFDELLGTSFPNPSQPVIDTPKPFTLTEEQRERLERNKKLAAEKRLAKLRERQRAEEMEQSSQELFGLPGETESRRDPMEVDDSIMVAEGTSEAPAVADHKQASSEITNANRVEEVSGERLAADSTLPAAADKVSATSKVTGDKVDDNLEDEMPSKVPCTDDILKDQMEDQCAGDILDGELEVPRTGDTLEGEMEREVLLAGDNLQNDKFETEGAATKDRGEMESDDSGELYINDNDDGEPEVAAAEKISVDKSKAKETEKESLVTADDVLDMLDEEDL